MYFQDLIAFAEVGADMFVVLHYIGLFGYTALYPLARLYGCVQWEPTKG